MSEILYTSTGLTIRRNDKNRFCVARLHYTADPAKRSEEWRKEAAAGMLPARWDKEYEIRYDALFGQKAFPEIMTFREFIVIPAGEWPNIAKVPEDRPGEIKQQCFGGFDYGARNPSSFHVYTIVDGVTYSIWELFEPCRNMRIFANRMKDCPYWDRVRYIAGDPSMWNNTQRNRYGNSCSIADLFREVGITKLLRGNNDEQAWMAQMRQHWGDPEHPTFKILDCCPNQIREFEMAAYASMPDRLLQDHNFKETLQDHDNHALDDAKYAMNTLRIQPTTKITFPSMISKWAIKR